MKGDKTVAEWSDTKALKTQSAFSRIHPTSFRLFSRSPDWLPLCEGGGAWLSALLRPEHDLVDEVDDGGGWLLGVQFGEQVAHVL